jgi:hypothetical protein
VATGTASSNTVVIKICHSPDQGVMTVVTFGICLNVLCRQTNGEHRIMATFTSTNNFGVINQRNGRPAGRGMAAIAKTTAIYVIGRFARLSNKI